MFEKISFEFERVISVRHGAPPPVFSLSQFRSLVRRRWKQPPPETKMSLSFGRHQLLFKGFITLSILPALDLLPSHSMFLSRLAERSGLFGILAPRKSKDTCESSRTKVNAAPEEGKPNGSAKGKITPANDEGDTRQSEKNDPENTVQQRRLDAQRKLEADAESRGVFAKKQRVRYHNKLQGRWDDAVIVGVHYDDGPDKPYYVSANVICSGHEPFYLSKRPSH